MPQGLPSLGAVLCHLKPLDPRTGQAVLSFWPPVILQNRLPLPLLLQLPPIRSAPPTPQRGAPAAPLVAPPGAAAGQLMEGHSRRALAAGGCLPLPVCYSGGELVRLRLGQAHQEDGAQQHSDWAGPFSQPLASPRMVGAAEEPAEPAPGEGVLLIPHPGDCALLELPRCAAGGLAAGAAGVAALDLSAGTMAAGAQQAQQQQVGGAGLECVQCVLVTEQQSEDLPLLRLSVVPLGVVHNCLPLDLVFEVRRGEVSM